jgi:hypothetical protein
MQTLTTCHVFTEVHTVLAKNFKHFTLQTHKSYEWEAVLRKYSMNTTVTLSVNLWCLQWLTVLLFAVCNGFSITFEHPTPNCYHMYVHCTSSAYFIFYNLLYIVMSLWLHIVCTEILTCCRICTHKMATEKSFFSQWLGIHFYFTFYGIA